jgi:hypothetical protein
VINLVSDTEEKESRVKVSKNRVQSINFAPKRAEIIRGWRKLHDNMLQNLYPPPNII